MPQTNKARTSGGSAGEGEVSGPESGEPPPARAGEADQSDPVIIKSPSDPKTYR